MTYPLIVAPWLASVITAHLGALVAEAVSLYVLYAYVDLL